jgi:hypothetical protein
VPNALLTWILAQGKGHYHCQVNNDDDGWKIILNLSLYSVVIWENSSFHNFQLEKTPPASDLPKKKMTKRYIPWKSVKTNVICRHQIAQSRS